MMDAIAMENELLEQTDDVIPVPVFQGCPHFGLCGDAGTKAMFATPRARCFKSETEQEVALAHQEHFCLRVVHDQCPVYQGRQEQRAQAAQSPLQVVGRLLSWLRPSLTPR